jgi:hypothetical protein
MGLLKKASELTKLCGVNLSLIFNDCRNQDIHFFSNSEMFNLTLSEEAKEDHSLIRYNYTDVKEIFILVSFQS